MALSNQEGEFELVEHRGEGSTSQRIQVPSRPSLAEDAQEGVTSFKADTFMLSQSEGTKDLEVLEVTEKRVSMYVLAFEEILATVLPLEAYLFTTKELAFFERYKSLSYEARYLLIRLLLRTPRIHRHSALVDSYETELGHHLIASAMDELCKPTPLEDKSNASNTSFRAQSGSEAKPWVIDDSDDEDIIEIPSRPPKSPSPSSPTAIIKDVKGKSKEMPLPLASSNNPYQLEEFKDLDLSSFCFDAITEYPEELFECMKLEELRTAAKGMKVWRTGMTRSALVESLLKSARTQSTLAFPTVASSSSTKSATSKKRGKLSFQPVTKRDGMDRLKKVICKVVGKTLRVNPDVRKLWARINLVYYRSTIAPPSLLLPQILTRSKKRFYPTYDQSRTLSIFPSRDHLLSYERALRLEEMIDTALGDQNILNSNGYQTFSIGNMDRHEAATLTVNIFESIFEAWKDLVAKAKKDKSRGSLTGARRVGDRYETGHILSRIVYKGAYALGIQRNFEREIAVLKELLKQKVWRRGKRGAWYERLALILMTHFKGDKKKKEEALDICIDGLEDDDTGLIYRPSLARRLSRLESQLKIPEKDRHVCAGVLQEAPIITLVANRIFSQGKGSATHEKEEKMEDLENILGSPPPPKENLAPENRNVTFWGTKSVWEGRDGTEVGVEQRVLEDWEDRGWKGFHAEGSIVTTIFAFLFWDVLFATMPGAFETKFQSSPLDLGEDSFAIARQELISKRISEIEQGKAIEIFLAVDDREREKETMCVGLKWDYSREDLLEIFQCLGGRSLAAICKMLSQDYGHRTSGVPDLFVWNYSEKKCSFIEVKGPGDNLSATQKIWIDVMLSSGVAVSVCRVVDGSQEPKAPKKRKSSDAPSKSAKRGPRIKKDDSDTGSEAESFGYESEGEAERYRDERDDIEGLMML